MYGIFISYNYYLLIIIINIFINPNKDFQQKINMIIIYFAFLSRNKENYIHLGNSVKCGVCSSWYRNFRKCGSSFYLARCGVVQDFSNGQRRHTKYVKILNKWIFNVSIREIN